MVQNTTVNWILMERVVAVLSPFKEVTDMLSKRDASISQVIPMATILSKTLEKSNNDKGVRKMKDDVREGIRLRFSEKENLDHFAVATILDPRYKDRFFTRSASKTGAVENLLALLKGATRRIKESEV